jgi:hypothetical protein
MDFRRVREAVLVNSITNRMRIGHAHLKINVDQPMDRVTYRSTRVSMTYPRTFYQPLISSQRPLMNTNER